MKTKDGYYFFYVGFENDIRQYASTKNRVEKKSLPQNYRLLMVNYSASE